MATPTTLTVTRPTDAVAQPGTWVRTGLIGGVVAGIVFAMFEMMAAAVLNGPSAFFMPLRMIGAIALDASALDPASSLLSAGAAGLVVHMVLSMMYGVAVAAVLALVPSLSRSTGAVVATAGAAGFGLWILNFFLLAGALGWSWFPNGQNVAVQVVAHTMMFGGVLGLLLDRFAFSRAR